MFILFGVFLLTSEADDSIVDDSRSTPGESSDGREIRDWIGARQRREELLTATIIDGLNALLDRDGGPPPGLHWLLCQDRASQSKLGADGHTRRGSFLPPVALPRRMWAAGEIRFLGRAGPDRRITRESTVAGIEEKRGVSGSLVFVHVDHHYSADHEPWLEERHSIVYREARRVHDAPRRLTVMDRRDSDRRLEIATDPVQLFRYSALTFNSHRIHYDHPYATGVEGYPGLVVHAPLMATWLMNFAERQFEASTLGGFSFRVHAPVFAGETITLLARESSDGLELAVLDRHEQRVVEANATLIPSRDSVRDQRSTSN